MSRILSILSILLISFPLQAFAFDQGYALWSKDLARFDDGGYVHYGKWQRNRERLDRFLAEMKAVSIPQMNGWSPAEREAFWINAYNAVVVDNILKVYPAINKLEDSSHKIAGQDITATYIRDKILRGSNARIPMVTDVLGVNTKIAQGHDLRALFAICDGTQASPRLANKAYTARHLSAELNAQVRRTAADPNFVQVDTRLRIFRMGDFFHKYQRDFTTYQGNAPLFTQTENRNKGVLRFIVSYLGKSVQDKVLAKQKMPWQVNYRISSYKLNGGE